MTTDPEIEIKLPEEYANDEFSGEPAQILNDKNMQSYMASHGF